MIIRYNNKSYECDLYDDPFEYNAEKKRALELFSKEENKFVDVIKLRKMLFAVRSQDALHWTSSNCDIYKAKKVIS